MYYMSNTAVISNKGLFLHLNLEFPRLFHDVTILWNSNLYKRWRDHFIHMEAYFKYLLGDPKYQGENMFIMWRIGKAERPPNIGEDALTTYNKTHIGFCVRVEWGVGGLKCKF